MCGVHRLLVARFLGGQSIHPVERCLGIAVGTVEWMVPTWYADEAAMPRSTSSRSMPRCAAISATEGDLPDLWTSSSVARRTSR